MGEVGADDRVDAAVAQLLQSHPPATTAPLDFWNAQFDAGLAWVDLPPDCGGMGASAGSRAAVDARLREAGAPSSNVDVNAMGHGLAADTIAVHGTPEQRARYMRPLFNSTEIWCQLFSEPGAGSDLAGLATRAVRDGDEWVVDGQKVWSSFAAHAKRGLLIARTSPDLPKHRGLTTFVVDMDAPGVDVRPLREMTGGAHFNEVFLTGLRIPDADRLGAVDNGWGVTLTTLMNERVLLSGSVPAPGSGPIRDAVALWAESKRDSEPARRDRLMQLWSRAECLRLTNARVAASHHGAAGPEGSIGKLAAAELNQEIHELCIDLLGAAGMVERTGGSAYTYLASDGAITWAFLRSRANTIEGGTSEVMRNIIGERVLGLPGEPRVGHNEPWSSSPR
ncbi:MAG TPA: acyl-CoA dehydrogenase family protein [Ilumatobacteraceae bacterium]